MSEIHNVFHVLFENLIRLTARHRANFIWKWQHITLASVGRRLIWHCCPSESRIRIWQRYTTPCSWMWDPNHELSYTIWLYVTKLAYVIKRLCEEPLLRYKPTSWRSNDVLAHVRKAINDLTLPPNLNLRYGYGKDTGSFSIWPFLAVDRSNHFDMERL